jgi:hypothetical protein
MANISFPRQFLYITAATIGAKLGWGFAGDYNLFVKIISALIGFYIVMTIVAFIMQVIFRKDL